MRGAEHLARIPIRLRLTLAFSAGMVVLLSAVGIFVYYHLKAGLDAGIDLTLRERASDLSALVAGVGPERVPELSPAPRRGENVAQVIDARGRVIAGSSRRALLFPSELARGRRETLVLQRGERIRLRAQPVRSRPGLVVVVGESLAQRERAMETEAGALLVGGPLALLLISGAAYGLAAGALRPVESMRRRARNISADEPAARLPLPEADDELRRLGETLNEMLDRLEAALAYERTFVANASHELRTPLAILKMELELALKSEAAGEEIGPALRSVIEEADRLTRLAEDLLVLARGDQRLPVRKEKIELRGLLEEVAGRFGLWADGDALVVDCPPGLTVEADRLRLEQALGNLVDNALRHGGAPVELSARAEDGSIELHVRDRGEGFPASVLPRAFDRFARGETGAGRAGAGLGLAIVASVAQAHGGQAGSANRDTGADVWLSLPRSAAGEVAAPVSEAR